MVVNGVWFFRVGMMLWLVINRGADGFNPDVHRTLASFAHYLLHRAVLDIDVATTERANSSARIAMAAGLSC
jgi:hypothetical protein